MFRVLFLHTWREMVRSVIWKRSLGASIFWGILITLLALNMLSFGLLFDRILTKIYPDRDPIQLINGILLYYLVADLLIRRFLQQTPVLKIRPFLILPLKRSTLVHFLISKSFLSLFNILPLLILVPVVVKVMVPAVSPLTAWFWTTGVFMLMLSNSLIHLYLDRQSALNPGRIILIVLFLVASLAADKFGLYSLRNVSTFIFGQLIDYPSMILIPAACADRIVSAELCYFS